MNALGRAGWACSAIFFALVLSSLLHIPHIGIAPILLAALAALAFWRPVYGIAAVVLLTPFAGVAAAMWWNGAVAWPETVVCAALIGLSLEAAWRRRTLRASLSAPALIFGALIVTAMIASLGIVALRLGPSFTDAIWIHFSRAHFVDVRGFPAIVAGVRLLEGVLLFALAARLSLSPAQWRSVAAAAIAGATVAALMNIRRLVQAAARGDDFFASLADLSQRFRWNLHYDDFNAAGSYFLLMLLLAGGLALTSTRARRALLISGAIPIAIALWLTSSRVAFLAGALAVIAVAVARRAPAGGRLRAGRFAAAAVATMAILIAIAVSLPKRGNQQSSLLAADVRIGLAQAAGRMIASSPVFGIGLGEFQQRSDEFASPELIAKFPVAVHENAHNNFLQVAAEMGLTGGIAFMWLIACGLLGVRRDAVALTALGAFVLTCLGGHPLLVAQPAFVFWPLLGAAAGAFHPDVAPGRRPRSWPAIIVVAILIALPWRMQLAAGGADLEHVGVGVTSVFQTSPDGYRYREGAGHVTLFVPTGAPFRFSVNPRTEAMTRLEVRVGGRVADVVQLAPNSWRTLSFPARSERRTSRFTAMELRLLESDETVLWITKVETLR